MIYVLILTLWGGEGSFTTTPAVATHEFSSEITCQLAGKSWAASIEKLPSAPKLKWLCVPK